MFQNWRESQFISKLKINQFFAAGIVNDKRKISPNDILCIAEGAVRE